MNFFGVKEKENLYGRIVPKIRAAMHKNTASENPHACDVQRNAEKVKFILKLLSLAVVRGQVEKEKGRMQGGPNQLRGVLT